MKAWQPALALSLLVVAARAGSASFPEDIGATIVAGASSAARLGEERSLAIACSATLPDGAITFVRRKRGPVLLGVMSARPLKDLRREFTENPRMADWGLVRDRNGDGRIDQVVFNIGPLPTEPANPPPNLPAIVGGTVAGGDIGLMFENMKPAFWQAVDADFDGTADVYAFPAARRVNGWHRGWAAVSADGATCRMIERDGSGAGGCTPGADGKELEGEAAVVHRWAARPELVFAGFDPAARQCRLGAADLSR